MRHHRHLEQQSWVSEWVCTRHISGALFFTASKRVSWIITASRHTLIFPNFLKQQRHSLIMMTATLSLTPPPPLQRLFTPLQFHQHHLSLFFVHWFCPHPLIQFKSPVLPLPCTNTLFLLALLHLHHQQRKQGTKRSEHTYTESHWGRRQSLEMTPESKCYF